MLGDPSIDTSSRTGKLLIGILALIAEFEKRHSARIADGWDQEGALIGLEGAHDHLR